MSITFLLLTLQNAAYSQDPFSSFLLEQERWEEDKKRNNEKVVQLYEVLKGKKATTYPKSS